MKKGNVRPKRAIRPAAGTEEALPLLLLLLTFVTCVCSFVSDPVIDSRLSKLLDSLEASATAAILLDGSLRRRLR